jgi:hypothetical protein
VPKKATKSVPNKEKLWLKQCAAIGDWWSVWIYRVTINGS